MSDPARLIYWRGRGGKPRAYLDLRALGGKRERLIAPGEHAATSDAVLALELAGRRLKAFLQERRSQVVQGIREPAQLATFASAHLVAKKKSGMVTDEWLHVSQRCLERAVEYFGAGRLLDSITVADVRTWAEWLSTQPGGRSGNATLSGGTIRHHLNTLSNLFRRAESEGAVPSGQNPVASLLEKPAAARREARWLEIHEAALLLEAARTYRPSDKRELLVAYPLLATFLLTGGRSAEVLGLELDDVSLDRRTVTFRANAWRRLKTATSPRVVPLWPQLEEILRTYLDLLRADAPPGQLLFASAGEGEEQPIVDVRKLLDRVAVRVGWHAGEIRTKMFRHTYCAARLQTLDQGAPVSLYTAARELGHGGLAMVQRVYAHLGHVRHRAEVVEYRVEQHRDRFDEDQREALEALIRETGGRP